MLTAKDILIRNASVYGSKGFEKSDVLISDGVIKTITKDFLPNNTFNQSNVSLKVVNANSGILIPSFVDMHVHFRQPGFEYKETIKTGSEAAAAGGFTTVCTMPNLNPAPDSIQNLEIQLSYIQKDAIIQVIPFATITMHRKGEKPVDFNALAPFVAGFSDDGSGIQSYEVMKLAMEGISKTGKILAAHCEVNDLIRGGYIHDGKYCALNNHLGICSESEWIEIDRNLKLAEETGCRLHICHVSTKESVDLIRKAKHKGINVTCETGPHYLTFCDGDLEEDGRFKMNPPLRDISDRDALRQGVCDGTIDVIATDHAPHSDNEKNRGLKGSAMGVVGLETAFSAIYTTMVKSGLMDFKRLIEVMCINPRKILGLQTYQYIEEGIEANLVIINPEEKYLVDPSSFKSLGKSSPYNGLDLTGKVKATICKGEFVFNSL